MRFLFFLIFGIVNILEAGTKVDSLESQLVVLSPRERVDAYRKLSDHYLTISVKQSIDYAEKAYLESKQIKSKKAQAENLYNLAGIYRYAKKYAKAIESYRKAANLYDNLGYKRKVALCHATIGSIRYETREFYLSEQIFVEVIYLCQKNKFKKIEAFCVSYIGNIYYELRKFSIALSYFKKSLSINKSINDNLSISTNLYSIGSIYNATGFYDDAIEYYLKALTIDRKIGNHEGIAMIYHAIGIIYEDLNNAKKSLEYNLRALRYKEKVQNKMFVVSCLNSIATNYYYLGKSEKSKYYLKQAEKIGLQSNLQRGLIMTYDNLGKFISADSRKEALRYLAAGIEKNKQVKDKWLQSRLNIHYASAMGNDRDLNKKIRILKDGLMIAQKIKTRDIIKEGYKKIAEYYTDIGDYKSAYQYQVRYSNLKDSLHIENVHKIADMQLRYETNKRDRENDILRQENRLQKLTINRNQMQLWQLYLSLSLVSIFVFIGYYRYFSRSKMSRNLRRKVELALRKYKEQEQALIHQMALTTLGELAAGIIHDLKQPLQDIKLSAEEIDLYLKKPNPDSRAVREAIDDIYDDINQMSSMTDYVNIYAYNKDYKAEEDFDVNKSVCNAHRMVRKQLMKQQLELTLDLEENIPSIKGNPWRFEQILLNLLTNSAHALREMKKYQSSQRNDKLIVKTYSTGSNVVIMVEDNGIGIVTSFKTKMFNIFATSKKPGEGTGLGMSIVYNAVRDMNGRLDFQSTPFVGTVFSLVFPFNGKN